MIEEVKRILDHECVYCDHKEAEDCTTCRAQQIDDLYQQKMRELFEEIEGKLAQLFYADIYEDIHVYPAWQSLKEKYESTKTKEA